jgi:putative ABC transport system permease protein
VIGILPKTFLYLPNRNAVDALLPQKMDPAAYFDRDLMRAWDSIGRLARGVTIEQARADFTTLFAAARRDNPRLYGNAAELRLVPYAERITGGVQLVLTLLLAAAGCVLLIACANVANLLLARGAARRKELAVRVALGASRARLVRQLLSENLVLAFAGGAAGCGIAFGAVQWLRASAGQRLPRLGELTVDARVLWFALLLSLGTSVLFGLLPAVSVTRADVSGWLKRAGRTRLQSTLVAGELALSVVLLVSAGLLLQSLWRLQHKRLGFDPENLVVTEVSLRGSQYEKAPRQTFYRELRDRMARIPGTLALAFTDGLPPGGGYSFVTMSRTGQPRTQVRSRGDMVTVRHVSPSYFETLLIPLQRGRLFADTDRDAGMINEALARRFFPGEDPIGKTFGNKPITIVGIVADAKNDGLASSPIPELLLPFDGANPDSIITVVVRTLGDWPRAAAALRQELREMDPRILDSIHTKREQFQSLTSQPRFNSGLFGSFAAIALLLAAVGIYGVVAFAVASRTHEIGIRMALGADGPRVVRFVLRDAAAPAMAGIVAGMCGAAAVGRYLASLLYDIKPADPVTYVAVAVLLLMVVLAASLIPARRACRVDPLSVLRAE